MPSRSFADLRPAFRTKAEAWLQDCLAAGLDVLIYCTLRTFAEQDELFEQGRSKPGKIVTYARAGQSAHNFGLALDFVPLIHGKPDWRAGNPQYVKAIQFAEARGMESASRWTKFREYPHLQELDWKSHV